MAHTNDNGQPCKECGEINCGIDDSDKEFIIKSIIGYKAALMKTLGFELGKAVSISGKELMLKHAAILECTIEVFCMISDSQNMDELQILEGVDHMKSAILDGVLSEERTRYKALDAATMLEFLLRKKPASENIH
jgi:hypothetical protein